MEDNSKMKETFKMYVMNREIPVTRNLEWIITDPQQVRRRNKVIYDYVNGGGNVQGDSLQH